MIGFPTGPLSRRPKGQQNEIVLLLYISFIEALWKFKQIEDLYHKLKHLSWVSHFVYAHLG